MVSPFGPGIYVHVPFCRQKCLYCSFVSGLCTPEAVQKYYQAVTAQILHMSVCTPWKEMEFSTIFFGGGTPSLLTGDMLCDLLQLIRRSFRVSTDQPEISIEINPATVTQQRLCRFRECGFNRLSIGVQSMQAAELKVLGRVHGVEDAGQTIEHAKAAGFEQFSVDLMYGLPGQDLVSWTDTLQQVLAYHPLHLSLYELTVEEGTPLAELVACGRLVMPDEDLVLAMMDRIDACLPPAGLRRYEISNYAVPGYACRHNCNYWHNGSYLGVGPSAVSSHQGTRWLTTCDPAAFNRGKGTGIDGSWEVEQLDHEAYFRETVMIGLRMVSGVDIRWLEQRFGWYVPDYYKDIIPKFQEYGLIVLENDWMFLSRKGMRVANMVMAEFV